MTLSQERLGEIVAGHRLGRDTLILLGWSGEDIPAHGVAILKKRQQGKGRFGAATWVSGDKRRWFLLVIHAPEAGLSQSGDGFQLHGAGAQMSTIAYAPASMPDADGFAGELLTHLGARTSEAVRFLIEIFPALSDAAPEPVRLLIAAALHAAAEESGVVEILGCADGESLILQGWIRDPHKVEPRLLIDSGKLEEHDAVFATFSRSDVAEPAMGFVALLRMDAAVTAAPRQIYIRSENRFLRLTVLPAAIHLRDEDVPQHLTHLMPNLRTDAAGQKVFRAACRPRYTGQDTVSSLHLPVRMAIDMTMFVPGAGWYVTGWLLDPSKLVSAVHLRGADGLSERLDGSWTRLARADVSAGFSNDPLFAGRIDHDLHGFTVFVPHRGESSRAGESGAWIELDLGGRAYAFMPVAVSLGDGAGERQRLLASVDLHKLTAMEIIERHLAPLFLARGTAPKRRRTFHAIRSAGRRSRTALIIPLADAAIKTKVVVAHLARSTLPGDVKPVFVCSPTAPDAARRLCHDLDFYGIAADVLVATEPVDDCEALEIGVDATDDALLAFLSPRVHSLGPSWLVDLLAALGEGRVPSAVSPTLIYEDGSVRYAGIDAVELTASAPYGSVVCSHAGYPRGALPRHDGRTLACAVECCAMTRSAFESVGGFSQAYASDNFKGVDLFLRMGAAGVRMSWTATTELYALDDLPVASDSAQVAKLVDGWSFRATWQNRPPTQSTEAANDATGADPVIALPDVARARVRAAAAG
jgi:hypothetical protein